MNIQFQAMLFSVDKLSDIRKDSSIPKCGHNYNQATSNWIIEMVLTGVFAEETYPNIPPLNLSEALAVYSILLPPVEHHY